MLTQNWVGPKSSSLINSPGQGAGVQSGCLAWECPAGTQWKEAQNQGTRGQALGSVAPMMRGLWVPGSHGPWLGLAWCPSSARLIRNGGERLVWSTPFQECLQLNGSKSYSRDKESKQTSSGLVLATLLKPITSHHLATQANAPQGPTQPFNPYFLHKK